MLRPIIQKFLFAFCFLQTANAFIPLPYNTDIYHPLADLMINVIDRYISSMTNTLNIVQNCILCRRQQVNFQTHLMNYFLMNFKAPLAFQFFNGETVNKPWEYNIFVVDSFQAFDEVTSHFPQTLYDREFYFLVVLTTDKGQYRKRYKTLRSIFGKVRDLKILNAVVLNRINNDTSCFYTYEYFTPKSCQDDIRVHEINRFSNGSLQNDYLFPPNRLSNFYNCTIRVTARIMPPLIGFSDDQDNVNPTGNIDALTGIEGDILKHLASALQFRINLTFPQTLNTIDENGNGTGCFAQLLSNEASIGIGGFSNSQPNRYFLTSSMSYYQAPYVFVFRSGLRFSSVKRLALPFSKGVWTILGIILTVSIIFLILLRIYAKPKLYAFIVGSKTKDPITNLITIFLGNPITILPRRNFARFLLTAWMLATLVLRNAYQAELFDSLRTSERIPLPRTIPELIAQKYELLSSNYTDFYPENMTSIIHVLYRRYGFVEMSSEHLTTVSLLDTLAFYNMRNWNTSRLTFMHEPIYHYQLVMFFEKHSVLRETFDNKLQQLISSGLTSYIARKHVKKYFQSINTLPERLPKISNRMLKALYMLYYMMVTISLIIFALEFRTRKSKRLKRFIDRMH